MQQLTRKPLFNPGGNADISARRIIGGDTTNLNDFNNMKYQWVSGWYRQAMNNFWIPEEINLSQDLKDYNNLTKIDEWILNKEIYEVNVEAEKISKVEAEDDPYSAVVDILAAKYDREKIFDFNYPLSDKVNKEDFEVLILKKFKMYRIGYQTMTAFKNALEVKLNEVMPKYNKMFNMLDGWDLFNDGERETRNVIDSRNTNSTSSSNGTNISDRRYSELPQNRLEDVQDGKYITDYNYDTDTNSMTGNNSINDNGTLNETINRSPSDKIKLYKEFQDDVNSIYTMIFIAIPHQFAPAPQLRE